MTPHEAAKMKAEKTAERDFNRGLTCDSSRYYARKGSAWDKWYTDRFLFLEVSMPEIFGAFTDKLAGS